MYAALSRPSDPLSTFILQRWHRNLVMPANNPRIGPNQYRGLNLSERTPCYMLTFLVRLLRG